MNPTRSIVQRAASLRLLTCIYGDQEVPIEHALATAWNRLESPDIAVLYRPMLDCELGLGNECLAIARGLRERQWLALETVLPHFAGEDIELPDDDAEMRAVARSWFELGWDREPPQDDA